MTNQAFVDNRFPLQLLGKEFELHFHFLQFLRVNCVIHNGQGLVVRHFLEFFLDAEEAHGHVLHGDTHDSGNLVVGHSFEPKQYDGAVEGFELVNALVEHLNLSRVFILVVEEIDTHFKRNARSALLLALLRNAGVKTHAPNPCFNFAFPFEVLKSPP